MDGAENGQQEEFGSRVERRIVLAYIDDKGRTDQYRDECSPYVHLTDSNIPMTKVT